MSINYGTLKFAKLCNKSGVKLNYSHQINEPAPLWTVEQVDSDPVENDFERITLDNKLPIGAWPFDCEKIIPCTSMPQQTCGCDYYAIDESLGNLLKGIGNETV